MSRKRPLPKRNTPPGDTTAHFASRLKHLRTQRGWSLEALEKASGVSRSMLSQIERARANPTLGVTFRIARAFGMSIGDLVETPGATSSISVIRSNDHAYHYRSDKHCVIRTLSPLNLEKDVEFYEVQLAEGGELRSSAHFEGTREFITVQKGRIRIESGNDAEELDPSDSASYRADVPHAIVNIGRGGAVLFLVDIYQ